MVSGVFLILILLKYLKFTVEFGEVTNIGGGGTSDFDELTNRPKYNDTTMSSDTNIPKVPAKTSDLTNDGSDGDSTYVEADELAKVATSGSYADLENKPSIPTVNDATLTITQNGTSKGTFTANDADDTTIEVPDTTYSNFTGTDGTAAGAAGLVPAPATTDAGKFLNYYYDKKIYEQDPFAKLDQNGVGKLVEMAAKLGRETRPDIHLGICGEHGGEPSSVEFCHRVGLDYVSCSPFRVPIARLAAAQASLRDKENK